MAHEGWRGCVGEGPEGVVELCEERGGEEGFALIEGVADYIACRGEMVRIGDGGGDG